MSLKSYQTLNKERVRYIASDQIILNLRRYLMKKIQQVLITSKTVVKSLRTVVRSLRIRVKF